MVANTHARSV